MEIAGNPRGLRHATGLSAPRCRAKRTPVIRQVRRAALDLRRYSSWAGPPGGQETRQPAPARGRHPTVAVDQIMTQTPSGAGNCARGLGWPPIAGCR